MEQYKHISRTQTIKIEGPIEIVFPLFTPEGEKKWADGWDFKLIYPEDGKIGDGYLFSTGSHDHKEAGALWIINRYNPKKYQISYYRIEPHIKIGAIEINCKTTKKNMTAVTVTYAYTGLSKKGNLFIDGFNQDGYREYIQSWATAINHFLKTGQTLSRFQT
jgi:hypothetical protein